jgi:hypothetical protein
MPRICNILLSSREMATQLLLSESLASRMQLQQREHRSTLPVWAEVATVFNDLSYRTESIGCDDPGFALIRFDPQYVAPGNNIITGKEVFAYFKLMKKRYSEIYDCFQVSGQHQPWFSGYCSKGDADCLYFHYAVLQTGNQDLIAWSGLGAKIECGIESFNPNLSHPVDLMTAASPSESSIASSQGSTASAPDQIADLDLEMESGVSIKTEKEDPGHTKARSTKRDAESSAESYAAKMAFRKIRQKTALDELVKVTDTIVKWEDLLMSKTSSPAYDPRNESQDVQMLRLNLSKLYKRLHELNLEEDQLA